MSNKLFHSVLRYVCIACLACPAAAHEPDHLLFDAYLQAPFHARADGSRTITLHFATMPGHGDGAVVAWQLDLLAPDGRVLRHWQGKHKLARNGAWSTVSVSWQTARRGNAVTAGRARSPAADDPPGIYSLRLRANVVGAPHLAAIEQRWQVAAGTRPAMLAPPAMASATRPEDWSGWPYAIYLGNLHSQTNHSDGGAALDHCAGAQAPGAAPYGPADAYQYAWRHGLDFLMTSEHNHMFDGAAGAQRAGADATADADTDSGGAARALYQRGLAQAAAWNDRGTGMLALYGQEWGVIANGGHINIFNAGALLGWERNGDGELLADHATPKSDYAALYTLLHTQGWYGQFNHPRHDQFAIGGKPLAWTADGDASMLLCEVMNSHAYSTRDDETEPRHGNYEAACNRLLEAGYHVAFSSNQDNHCANWGASYGNRTGVLLARGDALTADTLLAALKARRVFATMDKRGAIVLSAAGHMMGERFVHRGALALEVRHASSNGRSVAAVQLFHGMPGRRGTVRAISDSARTVVTPPVGEHFYYARITQDDGTLLWSAPLWVSQRK